jgi:CBS domain containing-hemolysin-like protein
VLAVDEAQRAQPLVAAQVRPLATVGPATSLYDALREMQRRGSHLAQVADAAAGFRGVVMLEDVLEELVGEVRGGTAA